ncbi:MAG TPA: DUF1549 and DUF1553 domain-containing protein [Bryobacteraceae bacterium]|jgi:hypothetical protein
MIVQRITLLLVTALCLTAATSTDDAENKFIGARGNYWAFQPISRVQPPSIADHWIRTPIDAFILSALRTKSLSPSAPLDRVPLIRRLTFDLTGLPPTPDEVKAFLNDRSANAYEKLVDRLLASPHYGERWAGKWLDVVRYADSNGFELDADRPHAWRYRDYVIAAFNQDKPYDRFIKEQLAGDELYPGNKEAIVATGFARAGQEHLVAGNIDPEVSRQEVLTEIATAVGQTFLAMTVNCARCHNHKFDPILQADYYRLEAVFAGAKGKEVEIATPDEKANWTAADKAYKERSKPIEDALTALQKPYADRLMAAKLATLDPKLQDAWHIPEAKRTPEEKILAQNASDQIEVTWDIVVAAMSAEDKEKRVQLRRRLHEIELTEPDPLASAYAYLDDGEAPQSYVLRMGDPHNRLAPVEPSVPRVIQASYRIPKASTGRRAAFAEWLISPANPLTARVMVNRIWQFRIGQGIVRTPNDFGVMGDRPSNRPLLDWLATEFVEKGWSVKAIDKLILMSSVYQQSAAPDPKREAIDPDNRLYWRMNRKRMEGEMLRDTILTASGLINPNMGGRPVRVPIEPEVYDLIFTEHERDGLWPLSPDVNEQYRRSIYLYNKRGMRLPLLSAFDQPDAITSCPVRPVSTHALQALTLFNSSFMQEQSQAFAKRLQSDCKSRGCMIDRAWRLTLSRAPQAKEIKLAQNFLASGGSISEMCLALFNRNEFVYVP